MKKNHFWPTYAPPFSYFVFNNESVPLSGWDGKFYCKHPNGEIILSNRTGCPAGCRISQKNRSIGIRLDFSVEIRPTQKERQRGEDGCEKNHIVCAMNSMGPKFEEFAEKKSRGAARREGGRTECDFFLLYYFPFGCTQSNALFQKTFLLFPRSGLRVKPKNTPPDK